MENENAELQEKARRAVELLQQMPTYRQIEQAFYEDNPQAAYDLLLAYELNRVDEWIADLLHEPDDEEALTMIHNKRDELQSRVKALMTASGQPGETPQCPCWIHGCRG